MGDVGRCHALYLPAHGDDTTDSASYNHLLALNGCMVMAEFPAIKDYAFV
jgi:hypothetical protein